MKRILLSTLALLFVQFSFGQQLELSGMAGWFWSSNPNYYNGSMKINDASNFYVSIASPYALRENAGIEFSYTSQTSDASFQEFTNDGIKYYNEQLTMDYYLLNGVFSMKPQEQVEPYALFGLGAANGRIKNVQGADRWKFAAGGGVGLKIRINEMLGIRLQGRLLAPMDFGNIGLYCGTGSGCGVGGGAFFTMIQGDFTGGLMLSF